MISFKLIIRELKYNILRYSLLFIIIVLGLTLIIGLSASADSVSSTVENSARAHHVEDGNFSLLVPLTKQDLKKIEKKGIEIEEQFYLDYYMQDKSVLRLFKDRNKINLIAVEAGKRAEANNDVVIEKNFALKHEYKLNDKIKIAGETFEIKGFATSPDYEFALKNMTDGVADANVFGTAFINEKMYEKIKQKNLTTSEEFNYSFLLNNKMSAKAFKEYLKDLEFNPLEIKNEFILGKIKKEMMAAGSSNAQANEKNKLNNLIAYIPQDLNPRIFASIDDVAVNKNISMYFGVIYILMISYVLAIFMAHNIETQSPIIGTLYAMGERKKSLLLRFIFPSVIVVFLGGLVGTLLGFIFVKELSFDITMMFSFPEIVFVYSPAVFAYGVGLPVVIAFITNFIMLNKKLSLKPLTLLRKEKKEFKKSRLELKNFKFMTLFRLRQFSREIKVNITLFFGLFVAIFIIIFGMSMYFGIENITNDLAKDVQFKNMYILKYLPEEIPEDGHEAYLMTLTSYCKYAKNDLNLSIQGLTDDNPFYKFKPLQEKDALVISNAVAQKFDWQIDDKVIMKDEFNHKNYEFIVKEIVDYSYGLFVFMDISQMREVFEMDKDFYNVLFADKDLDVDMELVSSIITKDDVQKIGELFQEEMGAIVFVLLISIVLFIGIMFLLVKMIIEKAVLNISLLKIFGFSKKEVEKLYLGSNFYTILITVITSVPISRWILNKIVPYMIYNFAGAINFSFNFGQYCKVIGIIVLSYIIANQILKRHLNKISLVEILKNRE